MAKSILRLLNNAAEFPFISDHVTRSLTEGQDATTRMPAYFSGARANIDFGQPQLIFCENVMPYPKGIYSVGYTEKYPPAIVDGTICDQLIALRDANENSLNFIPAQGANYVFNPVTETWSSVSPFAATRGLVTRAYVNGRTFVCYEKQRIIEYNPVGPAFTTVTLIYPPGLSIANVRGIGSASNYLLLFTDFAIHWCSPLNILDFNDLDAGAGNQTPNEIKGKITALMPCSGGTIIYTTKNAIGMTFTQNSNAPFIFREVRNCGGVKSWERVSESSEEGGHYIWGTHGLQRVNLSNAVQVHPEATDFLLGGILESWDELTSFVQVDEPGAFSVKVCFLVGRYLVISYGGGTSYFTHCIVYDTALERWGKLAVEHTDAFQWNNTGLTAVYTYDTLPSDYDALEELTYEDLDYVVLAPGVAKQGIAFMEQDGSVKRLNLSYIQNNALGIAVFGHIQERHNRYTTVLEIELTGMKDSPAPVVSLLSSETGDNRQDCIYLTQDLVDSDSKTRRYPAYQTAKNFDLAIEGSFVLTNVFATVMKHGSR